MDEELRVSLLESTSWPEQSSQERPDYQTKPLIGYAEKSVLHDSGIEATGLSRLPISLLGLKTGTLFSGTSTLTPLLDFGQRDLLYALQKMRQSRAARRDPSWPSQ